MERYEILSRASAFCVLPLAEVDKQGRAPLHPASRAALPPLHVLTTRHALFPFEFPQYYPGEEMAWLRYVKREHVRATLDFRADDGEGALQLAVPLDPDVFVHPRRDAAVCRLARAADARALLRGACALTRPRAHPRAGVFDDVEVAQDGSDGVARWAPVELAPRPRALLQQAAGGAGATAGVDEPARVLISGHVVRPATAVVDGEEEDDGVPVPARAWGTPAAVLAETDQVVVRTAGVEGGAGAPLGIGMCGGPVLFGADADVGDAPPCCVGLLEGIVAEPSAADGGASGAGAAAAGGADGGGGGGGGRFDHVVAHHSGGGGAADASADASADADAAATAEADARKREFARDHVGQAAFVTSDELRAFVSGVEDFQRLRWEAGVDARVGAAHRAMGAMGIPYPGTRVRVRVPR